VTAGETVARLFVRDRSAGEELARRVAGAFSFGDAAPPALDLVVGHLR
jgi:hypothetical protein